MRQRIPFLGDQEQQLARDDVDHSMNNPLGAVASDRHTNLLSDSAITKTPGGSLGDDNFVQRQDDRPLVRPEAVLEPPFTCCQFQARNASRWRGRFQTIRTRAMAKPTLFAQTLIWCSSDKYRCSSAAVQMVER